jgi:hypothetical protein
MSKPPAETSPGTRGRILAALYLFVIFAGITAQVLIRGVDEVTWRERAALAATSIWR